MEADEDRNAQNIDLFTAASRSEDWIHKRNCNSDTTTHGKNSILLVEDAMGHTVTFPVILPAGALFGITEIAHFKLKFDEAFVAIAQERSSGECGEHGTVLFLRVGCNRGK